MLTSFAVAPIYNMLRSESWACKRLQPYGGKVIRIRVLPLFSSSLLINLDGEIQHTGNTLDPDTTLSISPIVLARLLARDETALGDIKREGNQPLAEAFIDIGRHVNFNFQIEQNISKVIGDIPAHRLAQASQRVVAWHFGSIGNLSQALAEYWTEENPLLAKTRTVNTLSDDIKTLAYDIDRLEERIKKLTEQGASQSSP
jgi:ubiquinone biosynthesis protein UbiJ